MVRDVARVDGFLARVLAGVARVVGFVARVVGFVARVLADVARVVGFLARVLAGVARVDGFLARVLHYRCNAECTFPSEGVCRGKRRAETGCTSLAPHQSNPSISVLRLWGRMCIFFHCDTLSFFRRRQRHNSLWYANGVVVYTDNFSC